MRSSIIHAVNIDVLYASLYSRISKHHLGATADHWVSGTTRHPLGDMRQRHKFLTSARLTSLVRARPIDDQWP
ncbi:hypothetical protein COCSUDRAFT_33641 [Coccomyxa subellipsoidea C-169]|uniref:Uncharacterized protein n=1 Tax=Coccomyxa subellipsoidea (strain C-169) TaxID=574566 RepID=I0YSF5_COCSC|nr:hypothetical protein COCSUDRAFT_33641 [Coccomyxa subellipsoidea C-169]EIE21324.1 hypothetical protein COCSUDRAFT_33641 [Coccomyxa subellipsoidea C-169]|eukprot:XP_005645868.1 hypothetical protein COCSUDRAFT_33641 [Coccomyxa subellipsoidea C-169]